MKARSKEYANERAMYPEVGAWLRRLLRARFPKSAVQVADTSRITLSSYIEQEGLEDLFPGYQTFEINVDITGIVQSKRPTLAFVECKVTALTVRDMSQLLGYSKVAKPVYSILLSPAGISVALSLLLKIYRRYDVLEYAEGQRLKIGVWDAVRKTLDPATLIPPGEHFQSLLI